MEVWENEKCCGNTSRRRVFPQLFRVLPNLHECFCNSIETRRKCLLFPLENSPRKITKSKEDLIILFIIKTYLLYITQYTRHLNLNFFVFLSSYRNTIINQSPRVFSLSYFLNTEYNLMIYDVCNKCNIFITLCTINLLTVRYSYKRQSYNSELLNYSENPQ